MLRKPLKHLPVFREVAWTWLGTHTHPQAVLQVCRGWRMRSMWAKFRPLLHLKRLSKKQDTALRSLGCCHLSAGCVLRLSLVTTADSGRVPETDKASGSGRRRRGFCSCMKDTVYIYQDAIASKNKVWWGRLSRRGAVQSGGEDVFVSNRGFFKKTVTKPASGLLPVPALQKGLGTCTFCRITGFKLLFHTRIPFFLPKKKTTTSNPPPKKNTKAPQRKRTAHWLSFIILVEFW